jgi:hypothetical protein
MNILNPLIVLFVINNLRGSLIYIVIMYAKSLRQNPTKSLILLPMLRYALLHRYKVISVGRILTLRRVVGSEGSIQGSITIGGCCIVSLS